MEVCKFLDANPSVRPFVTPFYFRRFRRASIGSCCSIPVEKFDKRLNGGRIRFAIVSVEKGNNKAIKFLKKG